MKIDQIATGATQTVPPKGDSERKEDVKAADKEDRLVNCVELLAEEWGRPIGREALLAGLPLEAGRLTPALLDRALERVGLTGDIRQIELDTLQIFDLPAIVTSQRGKLAVLTERTDQGFTAIDPVTRQSYMLLVEGEWSGRRNLLVVKPAAAPDEGSFGAEDKGSSTRKWLIDALSGHWDSVAQVLLAAVFINMFAIAMPIFTMNVYDRVLPNQALSTLWVLAIGLFTVFVFDFTLKLARSAIIDTAGREIDFKLSTTLFERVMNTTIKDRPRSTGGFINRISQYEVLREFFTAHTIVMFVDILFLGVFVYVVGLLIGWVVLFPVIAALIAIVGTLVIGYLSRRAVKQALQESSNRNALLVEALSAAQTVKASRAEGEFQRKWERTILSTSETHSKMKWYQSLAGQLTATAGQFSSVAIILGATYSFAEGNISMGAIIASMMLSNRIISPISQISAALLRTRGAMEAYEALSGIMALPDERRSRKGAVARQVRKGALEFKKVRFAYPESKQFVLDQISFKVKPGEKVGIIGRVGSGKTTLGRLMVDFYQPTEGEVLVDGIAIGQYHPAELRRQVGLVLQDPELFNGSVRENILLSNPRATDEELISVARRTGVEEFVSRHPEGFDMKVGERGALLSGGQRQAVALARTMLTAPKILFLDEPSSSMDMATERQLVEQLQNGLAPEETVLISTHRYSLLKLVSRLIVLENGHIIADGPREEVMAHLKEKAEGGVR